MKVLLIDHYDSFVDMIADYLRQLKCQVIILKTDEINDQTLDILKPEKVIIGPGPGHPSDSGLIVTKQLLRLVLVRKIPVLGICLGHQLIAEYFGALVVKADFIAHGLKTKVIHNRDSFFSNIPTQFNVVRYHSLIVDKSSMSDTELEIIAMTESNEVMALRHNKLSCYGVQFHPESILTDCGLQILSNFLEV